MLYCCFIFGCFCSLFLALKWWAFLLHKALTLPEADLDGVMHSISLALKFSTKVTKEEGEMRKGSRFLKESVMRLRN